MKHVTARNLKPNVLSDQDLMSAIKSSKTLKIAAKALGLSLRTLERRAADLRVRGFSPEHDMTHPAPEGFALKGTSTLYDDHGKIKQQWVKTDRDAQAVYKMLSAAFEGFTSEIPKTPPVKRPIKQLEEDLANCYVITDYHFGMLSWGEETGADWDIKIAEDLLVAWFKVAIEQSPDAKVGIFGQLGDFLHWDGMDAVTPASKHLLDADTRFQKLVRAAIRAIRRIIAMLLEKHEEVHVLMAEGNHDPASSIWLREWCAAMYENDPRVTVDVSPDPYYCYEHGDTAIFFHHGHKRRPTNIDSVFVAKFREVFGRTKHAFAHMGHMHHIHVKETELMVIEQHRTLAAPDAYASRGGWMSGRDAKVITYSKKHGEAGRVTIPVSRVLH